MKAMSPKAKKVTKIVVDVIFWIFFVIALAFTVLAFTAQASPTGYPTIGGKALLTVQSDSMESKDGFYKGDLIVVKMFKTEKEDAATRKQEIAALKVKDVITFKMDINGDGLEELNTHRIIEILEKDGHVVFHTKGDNTSAQDPYNLYDSKVLGKWTGTRVGGLGAFINFLQPPQVGFFVVIILPLAGFLTYEIVYLVINVKKMKKGDKRTISAAEEELIKQKAVEEYLKKQEAEKQENSDK